MKHFLLFYETAPDYLDRRPEYRGAHLAHAQAAVARGDLVLGGALADPPDRAVLLFQGDNAEIARTFAARDPYVLKGLVTAWHVREWSTVVGDGAAIKLYQWLKST